jgi:hypothetical protein
VWKVILILAVLLGCCCNAQAGICDAYKIAKVDLERLSDLDKFYSVYFWFGDIPEKDRPMYILVFAGHLHGISREPSRTAFPQVITADYSVVRINFYNYGWSVGFVQRLAKADPYREYYLEVNDLPWPGGIWPGDGKYYAPWSKDDKSTFRVTRRLVPVLSASWMVWQTLIQDERDPGYLDALQLTSRADMDALSGFDKKVADKAQRFEYLEVPQFSGISRKYLRNVVMQPAAGRFRFGTEDAKKATREFDPLRPRTEFSKHDAEEWIFHLPNDFMGFFLSDDKGNSQDSAPDFVGFDRSTPPTSNDGKIHVGLSCLRCHYRKGLWGTGSAGVIDFVPHYRNTFTRFTQNSPDYHRLKDFARLYLRPFGDEVVIAKLRVNAAVIEATGLTADNWAMRLTTWFETYDYGATLTEAGAFIGCSSGDLVKYTPNGKLALDGMGKPIPGPLLQKAMVDYAKLTGLLDNNLALFAQGLRIPRDNYHEIYTTLAATWRTLHAKPFDPAEHIVDPNDPAYSVKEWLLQRKLPNGGVLPKLPTNIRLPIQSSRVQQLLQLQLSRSDTPVFGGVPTALGGNQWSGKLHAADCSQPILGAVSAECCYNNRYSTRHATAGTICTSPREDSLWASGSQWAKCWSGTGVTSYTDLSARLPEVSPGYDFQGGLCTLRGRRAISATRRGRRSQDYLPYCYEGSQATYASATC